MTIDNQIWGRMAQLTDRDEILEHLRRSFDHCEEALEGLSAADMPYGRSNEVVPPRTARQGG